MFHHNSSVKISSLTDGSSSTLMTGERKTKANVNWYSRWPGMIADGEEAFQRICGSADHVPNDPVAHFDDFSSNHVGGSQFCLADGSVHFISGNIDLAVYKALTTIQGGEIVTGQF